LATTGRTRGCLEDTLAQLLHLVVGYPLTKYLADIRGGVIDLIALSKMLPNETGDVYGMALHFLSSRLAKLGFFNAVLQRARCADKAAFIIDMSPALATDLTPIKTVRASG
jgi:hypothetical protein